MNRYLAVAEVAGALLEKAGVMAVAEGAAAHMARELTAIMEHTARSAAPAMRSRPAESVVLNELRSGKFLLGSKPVHSAVDLGSGLPKLAQFPASNSLGEAVYAKHSNHYYFADLRFGLKASPTPSGQHLRVEIESARGRSSDLISRLGLPTTPDGKALYARNIQDYHLGNATAEANLKVLTSGANREVFAGDGARSAVSTGGRNFEADPRTMFKAGHPTRVVSDLDSAAFNERVLALRGRQVSLPTGETGRLIGVDPHTNEALMFSAGKQFNLAQVRSVHGTYEMQAGVSANASKTIYRDAVGSTYSADFNGRLVAMKNVVVGQPSEITLRGGQTLSQALSLPADAGIRAQGTYHTGDFLSGNVRLSPILLRNIAFR